MGNLCKKIGHQNENCRNSPPSTITSRSVTPIMARYTGSFTGNEEINQEVRDLISLGKLQRSWADGLSEAQAEQRIHQILANGGDYDEPFETYNSNQGRPIFGNDELNREVQDLISRGRMNNSWADGLSEMDAEARLKQILTSDGDSYEPYDQDTFTSNQASMVFRDEELNREVEDLMERGRINDNWARGLNETQAEIKLRQILSGGDISFEPTPIEYHSGRDSGDSFEPTPIEYHSGRDSGDSYIPNRTGPIFASEELNREVEDLLSRGRITNNWASGLTTNQAEDKLKAILGGGSYEPPEYVQASYSGGQGGHVFRNEELNREVDDLLASGRLRDNWARGLNESQAEKRLKAILAGDDCSFETYPNDDNLPYSRASSSSSQTTFKGKNYKLFPLSTKDQEYRKIMEDFQRCSFGRKVVSIHRVQNNEQEKLYNGEIERLAEKMGYGFDLNIKDLYHGSTAPSEEICSHGLDQRLARIGCFGRGIYFSDNVKKCGEYIASSRKGAIYKCAVVLGDTKEYPYKERDPDLKREPAKGDGSIYHSVKGNVTDCDEFVIYENRRSLIKYRIILEKEDEETMIQNWLPHMHHMVETCTHEDMLDPEKERRFNDIFKQRLEKMRRVEIQKNLSLTDITYEFLRLLRKAQLGMKGPKPSTRLTDGNRKPVIKIPDLSGCSLADTDTLREFLKLTDCGDVELAESILENQQGNLDGAVNEYRSMMQ